jgi:hypothetical protein
MTMVRVRFPDDSHESQTVLIAFMDMRCTAHRVLQDPRSDVVVLGPAPLHGAVAPDGKPRHAMPYVTEPYAYLPGTAYRGQALNRSQSLG